MASLFEILFFHVWWTYDEKEPVGLSLLYHWFNIFEGLVWVIFSVLVFLRFLRHCSSQMEVYYGLLFVAFGASDFAEAWQQSSWLIWLKVFNLYGLVWTRTRVMRRCYPESSVY